jgi:hypothetical protein
MKMYGEVEVQRQALLMQAFEGGEWLGLRLGKQTSEQEAVSNLRGPEKFLVPARNRTTIPRSFSP